MDRIDIWRHVYVAYGKRAVDIILATLLLMVCSPIMLIVAWSILLDSPGSALYVQRRVGHGRREFTMYKFRTMVPGAENILLENPQLRDAMSVSWKLRQDPRVTKAGRTFRKTSLDELPQLWNVLKGDMSIVGPRPYLPKELNETFGAHADLITSVKPGMTGLWQVSGRSLLHPSLRIELDERYAQTCDVQLDIRILVKTVKVVVKRHGAL